MLLSLAPLSQSYDFFIAIFCCFILAFVWLYYAYKASKSGSVEKKSTGYPGGYQWIDSKVNVPIYQTGHFYMFILHVVFGTIIFILLWADHADVWFN